MASEQKRNLIREIVGATFKDEAIDKIESLTYTETSERATVRAGGELYPYDDAEYSRQIEGSITVRFLDPAVQAAMFGGTTITSGIVFVREESQAVATNVYLDIPSTASPLQSGHIVVRSSDGTTVFRHNDSGSPGIGEFSYASASGIDFNASESVSTVLVDYGYYTAASGEGVKHTKTSEATAGKLVVYNKVKSLEDDGVKYNCIVFPSVRFHSPSWNIGLGEQGSATIDFVGYADSAGDAVYNFVVSG